MVDFASYKTLHLNKQGSKKGANRRDNEPILASTLHSVHPPLAPEIYLFPLKITGFSLRRKRWSKWSYILTKIWSSFVFSGPRSGSYNRCFLEQKRL